MIFENLFKTPFEETPDEEIIAKAIELRDTNKYRVAYQEKKKKSKKQTTKKQDKVDEALEGLLKKHGVEL